MKQQNKKTSQQENQPTQPKREKNKERDVDIPVPIASIDQLNFPSV